MANFDIIEDANVHEGTLRSRHDEESPRFVPEPITIRGVGHLTL